MHAECLQAAAKKLQPSVTSKAQSSSCVHAAMTGTSHGTSCSLCLTSQAQPSTHVAAEHLHAATGKLFKTVLPCCRIPGFKPRLHLVKA